MNRQGIWLQLQAAGIERSGKDQPGHAFTLCREIGETDNLVDDE
jgi:hypothetical protein